MFRYSLKIKEKNGTVSYGPPLFFRILCLFFALVLLYFFILSIIEGTYSASALVPFFLSLILFFSGLVLDEIVFFPKERRVLIRFGLGPFYKRENISYEEIESLELVHFVKGRLASDAEPGKGAKAQVVLQIKLKDGDVRKIEVMAERASAGKVEEIARTLSTLTRIPIYIDRAPIEEKIDVHSLR